MGSPAWSKVGKEIYLVVVLCEVKTIIWQSKMSIFQMIQYLLELLESSKTRSVTAGSTRARGKLSDDATGRPD